MEYEPVSQGLPIITDEVAKNLSSDLLLDVDSQSNRIVAGITGETQSNPHDQALSLVDDVFRDLLVSQPSFAKGVLTTLKENPQFYAFRIDPFTAGMAIVVSAFDRMGNTSLIDKFSNLDEQDISDAMEKVRYSAKLSVEEVSVLENVISGPKIPDQQIGLNKIISRLSKRSGLERSYLEAGAATMYQILSKNWSKLSSNGGASPGQT